MLNLSGIVQDSIVDGPGIRTTIFCQGCPHHCPGCHNPETWAFGIGTDMEVERILDIVRENPLCRGVTFSGGEPFAQAAGYAKLAKLLKQAGYEVASYSGFTFEQLLEGNDDQRELLGSIDVLIDGPFVQEKKNLRLRFRGSENQRLIDLRLTEQAGHVISWTDQKEGEPSCRPSL